MNHRKNANSAKRMFRAAFGMTMKDYRKDAAAV